MVDVVSYSGGSTLSEAPVGKVLKYGTNICMKIERTGLLKRSTVLNDLERRGEVLLVNLVTGKAWSARGGQTCRIYENAEVILGG